jgi:hypothetical protein
VRRHLRARVLRLQLSLEASAFGLKRSATTFLRINEAGLERLE